VTFTETGLTTGASWGVFTKEPTRFVPLTTTDGSIASSFQLLAPQGTLSFSVRPETGYVASPSTGWVAIGGGATTVAITFGVLHEVMFNETGLPVGTNWSVTAAGVTSSSTGPTVAFSLTDGSQGFLVGPVEGYSAAPASGTVVVSGVSTEVSVTFTMTVATPPGPTPPTPVQVSVSGYTSADMAAIGVGGAGLALAAVALALALRKRPPN